jgi:Arc/MetJ family transcription regulator
MVGKWHRGGCSQYNPIMERTETRIDRALVERARERARREGREESDVIEDALRRYLGEVGEENFGEILDGVAAWQREHGVEPLSEEEALKLAVEEQHAHRRGE